MVSVFFFFFLCVVCPQKVYSSLLRERVPHTHTPKVVHTYHTIPSIRSIDRCTRIQKSTFFCRSVVKVVVWSSRPQKKDNNKEREREREREREKTKVDFVRKRRMNHHHHRLRCASTMRGGGGGAEKYRRAVTRTTRQRGRRVCSSRWRATTTMTTNGDTFRTHRHDARNRNVSADATRDDDTENVFDAFSQMPKTKRKKKEEENEREENGIEKSSNWRPAPPDISANAPREFSPISYALLGDAVWELVVRSYLFAPRSKPSTYDSKVKKLARAESQAYAYRKIISDGIRLTDEELDVCKWGRNADYSNVPKRLRGKKSQGGGHDIYRQASALEVILGWWMVTDDERLDEVLDLVKSSGWLEDALTLEYGFEEEEENEE